MQHIPLLTPSYPLLFHTGEIVHCPPGKKQKVELRVKEVLHFGPCNGKTYPISKTALSLDFLRTQAPLRPRTKTILAATRVRNTLFAATHAFFQHNGFLHIATPILTSSDCEGAGAMFSVDVHSKQDKSADNVANGAATNEEFFGRPMFLTVSGQLEAEAYACAMGNVYTFGPTFRAERSYSARHLSEFWMVEPELAFCDLSGVTRCAEAYIRHCCLAVLEQCPEEIEYFTQRYDKNVAPRLQGLVSNDFARITYTDAVKELDKAAADVFRSRPVWGDDLKVGFLFM